MNDMQLGRPYVHYEGEGGHQELPGHVSGEEASWVYRGHGYRFESGGELGGSDAHMLSGSLGNLSDGLIKHNIDYPSSIGSSDDYSHILSADHEIGTGSEYNHFEHGWNQFAGGDYGGVVSCLLCFRDKLYKCYQNSILSRYRVRSQIGLSAGHRL